jgi:hypothetical protein
MEVQTDFRDLFALFNAHRVDYIIVGAHALAYHGASRYTGDMDVFVPPDLENARRILQALDEFGLGTLGLTAEDFASPDRVIQIGVTPVRVDMVTSLTGVSWEEAAKGRVKGTYGDLGRRKDLTDLEAIGEE